MFDINKAISDPNWLNHDPEGHMYDLKRWSREIAQTQARVEGEVARFLRTNFGVS